MRTTVAWSVLGLALALPIQAEWTIESSRTFVAERAGVKHPCCPEVALALLRADSPARFCTYYANNFKKKDRGEVTAFVGVIGLESGEILTQMITFGGVQDNRWEYCVDWDFSNETCLVVAEFTLEGFPKMRKRRRQTDAFTAGIVVTPVADGSAAGESRPVGRD